MNINTITTDDLRRMEGKDGLILQGCGGDLKEWVDGINEMFTEAGILKDGSKFEDVSTFQYGDLTCLLYPFEDIKLDIGKLAVWRLQTHDTFGGTWLSDFVPNRLGGFIGEPSPEPEKPDCALIGQDGNIFNLVGIAARTLREHDLKDQAKEILAIVLVIFTLGMAVECLKRKMRKLSPLECMKYTEAVTYHKSRKKPKIKKFRYWGKHPEIYLAKKYLFRNKKTFGITSLSLWLGCELALCSAVIVNGVDLQNYYSKEPDFQIGITEEACNYLIESSPDTKNMKFFPKSLMNDIETTIGNELHSVENIKGFYPIVGKNGKENIKILINGDKISTVIQTVSIGEQEELKDFIQKNDKLVNWEQFQNNHGTIVLHDHRMSDYIAGEVQDYIGTEMEFYDLVPVGTEMSSLVPEKLVNCGYLDITENDFPEMKLCWDGKNINILLVTETTYDWLVEKLTPQIFEIQFNVDKNQESVIRERLNQMIRNYNMEFQSKYGHADKLNLFYLDSKSERLLKEQNYIQTSRWLLMSISGILIFIGIMNFANTRISDIMLRQWECKILERVGMTKKQEYRMFVTEGLFYWLLLCGLLMSFGNLGIGIMQWYMKMQISYFAFRYPVKEMIALMVLLLLFSIIFPGIIYKKLKKKGK